MLASGQKKRKLVKKSKIRHAEYYGLQMTFDELHQKGRNSIPLQSIMEIISSRENILLAYRNIKTNTGSKTAGVDRRTMKDFAKLNEEQFVRLVQKQFVWYNPHPVKRKEIPKPNGKTRPLGIPTILDRIVQQCILQVLEPYCEAKFFKHSYGFRPDRSAEHAIARCHSLINKSHMHYVVDIDIQGFFDHVCHTKLIQQMWEMGIQDKKLLCIIKAMLKTPIVLPSGEKIYPQEGTPQGGILSPLLSNIVLNELDWWIASQWENIPTRNITEQIDKKGIPIKSGKYKLLRNYSRLKRVFIVRYADDFRLFCDNYQGAKRIFEATKMWLHDRLKLEVSAEKSKIVNLQKQYSEFLGFRLKVVGKGDKLVVKSHICEKANDKIRKSLKKHIEKIKFPKDNEQQYYNIQNYNSVVMGLHNYYSLATEASCDFAKIAFDVGKSLHNRLASLGLSKEGKIPSVAIKERYGNSEQTRFLNGHPIIPIGYIRHKIPKSKNVMVNRCTPEGREFIHKNLKINTQILIWLMQNPVSGRSIEYADNRISLYAAQYGKCAITGAFLKPEDIHCHHIVPVKQGGTDKYSNLIIVHFDIHRLIHAKKEETIQAYLEKLKLGKTKINKLNKYRQKAGLSTI